LLKKDGWWHFFRRVPKHMAEFDARRFVKKATKIRVAHDPNGRLAAKRAHDFNNHLERDWTDMIAGRNNSARSHLRDAAKRAVQLGIGYHSASEIAASQLDEILMRIDLLGTRANIDNRIDQTAVLGGARASVLLSDLFEQYEKHVAVEMRREKSPKQLAKWRSERIHAVKRLIEIIGDKDILAITRDDAKQFRAYWAKRIMEENLATEGARRDIAQIAKMIRIIAKRDGFEDPDIFKGLHFAKTSNQRIGFKIEFVRNVIMKPGTFKGMPQDALDILMVCTETGARPSEVVGLDKRNIHLRVNIPYIAIRADLRELKSKNSARDIPLVGAALEAMRRNPNGFPQWFDKGPEVGKVINKWLRALQPDVNPDAGDEFKTLYCLRHTFKDRLRNADAPDGMMLQLMGHDHGVTGKTPKYGIGYSMEKKLAKLNQIAFPVARLIARRA
jgi:integrase